MSDPHERAYLRAAGGVPCLPVEDAVIYLATPYSHPDPAIMQARLEQACEIAGHLMRNGHVIFCPIAHTHSIAVRCKLPRGWDFWRRYDRAMLSRASKLLVVKMDGWRESVGIANEEALAIELGLPIEYMEPPERQEMRL